MAPRRTSIGRQKIEIRRIESEEARQVCFSKRRAGLFNKASELAVMCGAQVAAVVFSPAGKAFSYGHPSVEAIIERFDPTGAVPVTGGGGGDAGENNNLLADLHRQRAELKARLAAEKAKKERTLAAMEMAKERSAESPVWALLEGNVRDIGDAELMKLVEALQVVQAAVDARHNQDALNHGNTMAASRTRSSMAPVTTQRLLGMGAGGHGRFGFGAGSSASSSGNNGAEMDIQMQPMKAMMPPPQGFAVPGMGFPAHTNQMLQDGINHGNTMASSRNRSNMVPMTTPQLLGMGAGGHGWCNVGAGNSSSANNGAEMDIQMQKMVAVMPPPQGFAVPGMEQQRGFGFPAHTNQIFQDGINHGNTMETSRNRSNMVPVMTQQQPLLGMGAGGHGRFDFGARSRSSANNGAEMDIQMQQMLAMMPPPPQGFAVPGMEQQQGFGFPAHTNQMLQDGINHGNTMATSSNRFNMVPVTTQQQQLIGMGAGGHGRFDFGAGSSSSANNSEEMDIQMQQMMAMMPPLPQGFAVPGMEQQQQGFGFPGPY